MKITKRQLRRIIREENARLIKEAPAGQYNQELAELFKDAVIETIYEVAVEEGLVNDNNIDITPEAIQAAAAGLSDAAREMAKSIPLAGLPGE